MVLTMLFIWTPTKLKETDKSWYGSQTFSDVKCAHKVSWEMFARMKTAYIAPLPLKRVVCAFALNKRQVLLN
jgi:hypothetical protein